MYTQCPDCGTAFRVTAEVLRVAAGNVRCGGCAHAFNALDFLSEEMPEQKSAEPEVEQSLPELTPDPPTRESNLPESISAEQSAALLKTLDELAGSDIRIEDTGVEWRVLEDDDDDDDDAALNEIDEILEDSPTQVDEFLTSTPEIVDSPEIFEESANAPAQTPVEELRFDDNTPLPEDFGFEDDAASSSAVIEPELESEPEAEELQPDITLSDPHEWTDILDEVEELAVDVDRPLDAELDALLDDEPDRAKESDDVEEDEPTVIDELEDEDAEDVVDDEDDDPVFDVPDADPQLDLIDEPDVEEHGIEAELALIAGDEDEDDIELVADDESDDSDEHAIPPMSEEEHTVNMQIDQELLAIAVEDDDGFASTMVIPEEMGGDDALADAGDDGSNDIAALASRMGGSDIGFESIVMEGEEVKTALAEEKRAQDVAEAAELQAIAKAAEVDAAQKSGGSRYGMIAGVVVLVVILIVQVIHQSREALATNPVFNDTVGPIYRALGNPLQPAWDITGWQFEATRGSAEVETEANSTETSETLTVYSRIGNNSQDALPYPLIRISLTDRFQEPLGSHVLEPADYLGGNMDPRKLVDPGESFEAAITIASPSEDATGFRLDVCYRHSEQQLRCKDENFK